jgi:hypothetical protein
MAAGALKQASSPETPLAEALVRWFRSDLLFSPCCNKSRSAPHGRLHPTR